MKAVVVGAGGVLGVESLPDPVPGRGELVLRVAACGICGSDLALHGRRAFRPGTVMGHEFCGEVMESAHGFRAGESVCALPVLSCGNCSRCRSGLGAYCETQRLLGMGDAAGAFAEYVAVSAHEAVRLPSSVGAVAGALIEPLAVGLHAVRVGRLRRDDSCLVLGGGPIGLGAALWARYFGARDVVVCERAEARRRLAERLGAGSAVPPEALPEALGRLLPGGASVVIEAVGAPGMVQRALECLRFRGRVVVAGVCFGSDRFEPFPALGREASVHFVLAYEKDDFQYTIDAIAAGRIDPLPMVTGRSALEAIPGAFAELAGPSEHGKVLYVR
jgi:(R,R)-butanediol dehydrogenase/meso-butanediol dehydrogenase/diacetyl reductase